VPIFIVQYWIDKYTLLKRSAVLPVLSHDYSLLALKLFDVSLLFFSFGNFYFSWKIEGSFNKINTASLLIASIYTSVVVFFP